MKQFIVFCLIAVILGLAAGCSEKEAGAAPPAAAPDAEAAAPAAPDAPAPDGKAEADSAPAGKTYATLAEIKAENTPMKCTWATPQGGSGMARVYGEFIRTESTFGGKTYYMTDDGVYRYTWTQGEPQGTKISTELQKKMEAEAGTEKIRGEYHCVPEAVPPEGFAAPHGKVLFIDVGAAYG